ncbi:MAG: DUF1015 domain-containing protein [Clostridia bacterium]|nr:DUF1015 domain-containing protein [Clostridia bacterium]
MAEIRAFRALRFDRTAGAPEQLVCPPYDIISEQQRQGYLQRNPHNIIRLELPRDGEDPYRQAAETLAGWQAEGLLRQDERPGYYIYEIEFSTDGMDGCPLGPGRHSVAGIIAQVHLEEFSKGIILPHEETLSKAKADRFELMKATACNFSNIYSLYMDSDAGEPSAPMLQQLMAVPADVELTDEAGSIHRLWTVDDPVWIKRITDKFRGVRLYIADGHHRYETALKYRDTMREQGVPAGEASDYVMMYLVEMEHPGLAVFPTHRLLRDLPDFDAAALLQACEREFVVTRGLPLCEMNDRMLEAYKKGQKTFGLYTGGDKYAALTLRDIRLSDEQLAGFPPAVRHLDVQILHSMILERLLGIDKENMKNQVNLTYTRSLSQAIGQVRDGAAQACFILNPTRVTEIRDVAAAGAKMPQKSTYFYPKLITGLTMNVLK